MSTGFFTEAAAGRKERSSAFVSSLIGAICMPNSQTASVAMMPGPPELVTIATRSPFGIGQLANTLAVEKRSLSDISRMTPDCFKSASAARSPPAREPVCEEAAEAPAAERPALSATMGFFLEMRVASLRKFAGSGIDSM